MIYRTPIILISGVLLYDAIFIVSTTSCMYAGSIEESVITTPTIISPEDQRFLLFLHELTKRVDSLNISHEDLILVRRVIENRGFYEQTSYNVAAFDELTNHYNDNLKTNDVSFVENHLKGCFAYFSKTANSLLDFYVEEIPLEKARSKLVETSHAMKSVQNVHEDLCVKVKELSLESENQVFTELVDRYDGQCKKLLETESKNVTALLSNAEAELKICVRSFDKTILRDHYDSAMVYIKKASRALQKLPEEIQNKFQDSYTTMLDTAYDQKEYLDHVEIPTRIGSTIIKHIVPGTACEPTTLSDIRNLANPPEIKEPESISFFSKHQGKIIPVIAGITVLGCITWAISQGHVDDVISTAYKTYKSFFPEKPLD